MAEKDDWSSSRALQPCAVGIGESVKMRKSISAYLSRLVTVREMTALWQLVPHMHTLHTHATHITHQEHSMATTYYDFMWRAQCAMWHHAFLTLLHLTTTVALCQANSAVKSSGKPPCDFLALLLQISRCAKHTTWEKPLKTKASPDVSGPSFPLCPLRV